jgi:DNA-binding LacI/PurR family transcriptional regulator
VPAEVSVVGFDDTPDSGYFLPPLTTIRQNFAELGRRSLDTLVQRITTGEDQPAEHALLSPELVVRASTAAAPR